MNQNIVRVAVPSLAFVAVAAGWVLLPSLRSSAHAVNVEASLQLEQARRLLHRHDPELAYASTLIDLLAEEGIEADANDVADELADDYQTTHKRMWEAYTPTDWGHRGPTEARANYGNLSGQISEGLREHANLVGENNRLLSAALRRVDQAIAVTVNTASARSHAEANRLRAVILHQQGMVAWTKARLLRRQCESFRRKLATLTAGVPEASASTTLVADSGIDAQIVGLRGFLAETEATLQADTEALVGLQDRVLRLETRLAAAQAQVAQAQQSMAHLKTEGMDFSDPNGASVFQGKLQTLDLTFRQAAREAHALELGTFPAAQLDRSGDYLHGKYIESGSPENLTVVYGLAHYQDELAIATVQIAARGSGVVTLKDDLTRLEDLRATYQTEQDRAVERLAGTAAAAEEAFDDLNRADAEAFALEDDALALFDRAAKGAQLAARAAGDWVNEARSQTQGLSPEGKDRSPFTMRESDGWMGGFIAAGEGDAQVASAWVYYDKFQAAQRNAALFARIVEPLGLKEADADAEKEKASQAHDDGVAQIDKAMAVFKNAHRGTSRHWTVSANAAGATYLMVLFGHDDYKKDTIETYRNALKGRENEPFTKVIAARLARLEAR